MTSYTAINFIPAYIGNLVVQTAHGFNVGNVVRLNGGTWTLALADSTLDALSVGIVSSLPAANPLNTFVVTQIGWVSGFDAETGPFTPGTLYYLSDTTPGELNPNPGDVVLPLFIADTSSSGYFQNSYPIVDGGGGSGRMPFQVITSSQTLLANNGYFVDGGSQLSLLLPATSNVGDTIVINSLNSVGYVITQRAPDQVIVVGSNVSTVGSAGSVTSVSAIGDSLTLVCSEANIEWNAISVVGSFFVT